MNFLIFSTGLKTPVSENTPVKKPTRVWLSSAVALAVNPFVDAASQY